MSCPFQVGDEVEWFPHDNNPLAKIYDLWMNIFNPECPWEGRPHGVQIVVEVEQHPHLPDIYGLGFKGREPELFPHFAYRKVNRRDLEAWLATAAPVDPALPLPREPVRRREREAA